MKKRQKLLTDEQWKLIEPLLPKPKRRRDRRGRPAAANRACLEGILWVLQTGAAWRFLPDEFPSPSTCWRRLQRWQEQGVWLSAWRTLLGTLDERGLLKWDETFLDGSFAPAKKGAAQSEKPSVARGRRSWRWQTVMGCQLLFARRVPLPRGDASCLHFATDGCSRCAAELGWGQCLRLRPPRRRTEVLRD